MFLYNYHSETPMNIDAFKDVSFFFFLKILNREG